MSELLEPLMAETAEHALALMASLRLEDGRRWGEVAAPYQRADARAILAGEPPYHFLTRPRGGSKTTDCAAACIAVMLVQAPPGAQLYVFAADRDQARLVLDAVAGFVRRTPQLSDLIEIHAFRARVRSTDVTLHISAADAEGSWGLRPYLVIVDEFAMWPETEKPQQLFESIRSSVPKTRARLIVLTTAGDPAHFSYKEREHAERDELWRLNEVPGPLPWIPSDLLEEQRRALPDASFRHLHLNQWVSADDGLTTLSDLKAATQPWSSCPPKPGTSYVIGLDLGITHDRSVLAVCHAEPPAGGERRSPVIVVDEVQRWEGTRDQPVMLEDVADAAYATARAYNNAKVVFDPHQAVHLGQQLKGRGVSAEPYLFSAPSNNRLATTLHLLLRNRRLQLPNDRVLLDELARVRMTEARPGLLRLTHKSGQHDDQAVAIALAADHALEQAETPGPRFRGLIAQPPPPRFRGFRR